MDAEDLLLDETGDLLEVNDNDIVGFSDEQHIEDILTAYPGEYKQFPLIGVNIRRAVNGSIDGNIRRDIRLNLESDNYSVATIKFTEDQLQIDANRKG